MIIRTKLLFAALFAAASFPVMFAQAPDIVDPSESVSAETQVSEAASLPPPQEFSDAVYRSVKDALTSFPHRVPGSQEYYDSIDLLEKILKENGLDVQRQVFPVFMPDYHTRIFKVNGVDAKIAPLSPNGLNLVTTWEKPIVGEAVFLSKKELYQSYKGIAGKVAFLEWGENYYPKTLFTEGAKAIVFIGNDIATQSEIAKLKSQYPISYPYFYMTKEEAEKMGLMKPYDPKNPIQVELCFQGRWKQADGINLWIKLPAKDAENGQPPVFKLNRPEAILLGARMDTFGEVVYEVRGDRNTANMALLAQNLVYLSKKPLDRTVFAVFFGGSYNAYDSLRYFLYPISTRDSNKDPRIIDYAIGFREELQDTDKVLETLDREPIVKKEDDFQFRARILIRDIVVKRYNAINQSMADLNVHIRDLNNIVNDGKERITEALCASEIQTIETELAAESLPVERRAELQTKLDALKEIQVCFATRERDEKRKILTAELRRCVNECALNDEVRPLLADVIEEIKAQLTVRKDELSFSIRVAEDWERIQEATKPYAFLASYYFDFASDQQPFIMATRSFEYPHSFFEMSVSLYSKYFTELSKILPTLAMQKGKTPLLEKSLEPNFTPDMLSSRSLLYLPSAVGLAMKLPGFTLRNIPGDYDYDELPGKRDFNLAGLIPVMDEFFSTIIQAPELSMYSMLKDSHMLDDYFTYYYKSKTAKKFNYLAADGKEIDGPAANAFVFLRPNNWNRIYPICGFSLAPFGQVNQSGYATMPFLTHGSPGRWVRAGVDLNDNTNAIAFDDIGRVEWISTQGDYSKLFRCYGGSHTYTYAPLTSNFAGSLTFVNGENDATFKNQNTFARIPTGDGFAYVDRPTKAKMYFFEETFVLGSTPKDPIGKGIDISPESLLNLNVSRIAIDNTILLNLGRLDKIHRRNIYNSIIEDYHDRAEQHQIDAKKALEDGNINLARAHEIFGQTLAIRAYRPLKDMINDLVRSVLILLILTIPFAFALERLLVGATNVYKQMGWNVAFFLLTFTMLYFTHPAFALSQAPMIIFIAFFIIVLSIMVIYIVMNRFKSELMTMQGLDTSAHRVNSENSMILAAIIIGVSSMKNRPVKTFLTILTVILLTFTIISFASFDNTGYVRATYIGDSSGELRIETYLNNHSDMLISTDQAIRDIYEKDYQVFSRSASSLLPYYNSGMYPIQANLAYNPETRSVIQLDAVVGFEPKEIEFCAKLRTVAPALAYVEDIADATPWVYLAESTAKFLGLQVDDVFYLRNMKVRLKGVFQPSELDSFGYLDDGKASPPDFKATSEIGSNIWALSQEGDMSAFLWSSPDVTVVTDLETAKKLNGFVNATILYPRPGNNPDILKDATNISEVVFGVVYSNTSNGVHRHLFSNSYSVSGASNLFVPLLLGALIILSSLLGSIADREREIFTFSALGLSPKDVSVLFFAESGVYAVIGGLGGYLLSQLTTTILNKLSEYGYIQAPEVNYSSSSTINTILLVMAIVLLSTIYPAIKAGRAANPEVARKWKMPPPNGDKLLFQFPFTVSRVDFGGILVFISEHFKNHSDSSLGSFAAADVSISRGKPGLTEGYILSANLTLAPFDLGVSEDFYMYSAPSDIEGIDVVTVSVIRKDGSQGAWIRGNQRFVDEIRNQFLLWRSLPVETVLHYRSLAVENKNEA